MSFTDLGVPAPMVSVLAAAGIVTPFPIQAAVIADAAAGRDVLGQGRTGSGKTVAYAVPLVMRLAATPSPREPRRPRGLVLAPTRELAAQVHRTLVPLAEAMGLRCVLVHGGVGYGPQRTALAAGVDVVVACPGRLLDLAADGSVALAAVDVVVIDEADHMADQGFLPPVRRILTATASGGQRMLFSATLAGGVDPLVREHLTAPAVHTVAEAPPPTLSHTVLLVADTDRVATLARLTGAGRAVVFCRTKHRARTLARRLTAAGVAAVELHGNLSQPARQRNLAAFSAGSATVLVATDIAARGIHVDGVDLVVHADPPVEHRAYTHRSGRTARAGAAGEVVTFTTADQRDEVAGLLRRAAVTAVWSPPSAEPATAGRPRRR